MSTPIHVFSIAGPQGTRRVAIPGAYCASRYPRLRTGERVVDRTWRSDWQYLDHPNNSQPDYQQGLYH